MYRSSLLFLAWFGLGLAAAWAVDPSAPTVHYQLIAGMPPVLESDVQRNDAETPIVAPVDYFREGDVFQIKTTAALSGPEGWVKVVHEWVEPITAPDGTAPKVASDEMILVEVHGAVTVQSPGKAPVTVTEGMDLPSGGTVTTGQDGTVAVFIGGINSVRMGPSSRATIGYQVVGPFRVSPSEKPIQRRTTIVQLDEGKVFSKIGYEPQVNQYFQLKTNMGSAVASSGDFIVLKEKNSLELGVARGVVRLVDDKGADLVTLTANNQSGLQLVHIPEPKGGQLAMMTANSRFLESTLSFILLVNNKVRALRERHEKGELMTKAERDYMERLPTFTFLQRVRKM